MPLAPHPIRSYVARETALGGLVNALFSVAVFLVAFGRHPFIPVWASIPVWGVGHLAFDFAPQSFGVAFMSTLVPGLVARRNLRSGKVPAIEGHSVLPQSLLRRAMLVGMASACLGWACWALLFRLLGMEQIAWLTALVVKATYGAVLGSATIVWTLPMALRRPQTRN